MLFAFDGHAFPIDQEILSYLKSHDAVEQSSSLEDAQKFVEHHLKAEECRDFYLALRKAAGEPAKKKK